MVKFAALTLFLVATVQARNLKGKSTKAKKYPVQLGPRPYFMVNSMKDGELKDKLSKCAEKKMDFEVSDWSIGHRGACMQVSVYIHNVPHSNINVVVLHEIKILSET